MGIAVGKLRISGAAFLALLAACFFDIGGLIVTVLAALLIHELGHLAILYCLGYKITEFRVDLWGLTIRYDKTQSYVHGIITAAAGPLASLLLAFGASYFGRWNNCGGAYVLAGVSLVCCVFNLLPVRRLDGGRILYDAAAYFFGLDFAEKLLCISSCVIIGGLLVLGATVLIWTRLNFTLLLAAVWLLISYCQNGGVRIELKGKNVGCV